MKKLLGLGLTLIAALAHAQALPPIGASQVVCGQSSLIPIGCTTLPNGLNLGIPSFIDLTNAVNIPPGGLAPIVTGSVLGNFQGSTQAPQAYPAILITSGTNGGILAFNGTNSLTSSGALAANNFVVGGGVGGVPTTLAGTGIPSIASGVITVLTLNPGGLASNIALGNGGPLGALTTGISNTCAGQNCFATMTTTNSNTGFGLSCGRYQTGGNNTCNGSLAMTGISGTPGTGNNNTADGFQSLTLLQGAAGGNTGVGANTCSSLTTGSANTCIGNAVGSAGMGTNTAVLLMGTTNACVPTSTSSANEIHLCAGSTDALLMTGTNTPTTSKAQFLGSLYAATVGTSGTTFTVAGTGACATTTTLAGGASGGSFLCTGTAGASTFTVTLPTAPNGNGYGCWGSDITSGVVFAQLTPTSTTSCKMTGTIATTSDKVVFGTFTY